MPELPEVETVCRGLARRLAGRRFAAVDVRRSHLRWPLPPHFASRLTGRRIEAVRRRAKYILVELDDDGVLMIHLGMSGRLYIDGDSERTHAHDHVIFRLDDGGRIVFNDARRFGMMDLADRARLDQHRLLKALGPDPLARNFTAPVLAAALKGKKTSVKAALMDQRLVAGLGNIYVSEALFRAGIAPKRRAGTITGPRVAGLVRAIRAVLREAIAAGGSTLRDYVQASGELGYFQARFRVYDRAGQPCRTCGTPIRRLVQTGRATYYCPTCQR